MIERFIPPLAVVIVGRPGSENWFFGTEKDGKPRTLADSLFRCLSYDIGNPNAFHPAIPVYFAMGDFSSSDKKSQPPFTAEMARAACIVVVMLLDSDFQSAADRWIEFFDRIREEQRKQNPGHTVRFFPLSRTKERGQLGTHLRNLGLERAAQVYVPPDDETLEAPQEAERFFRIKVMIEAIRALRTAAGDTAGLRVFVSYTSRDGEDGPNKIAQAFGKHRGMGVEVILDSMIPDSTDGPALVGELAKCTCVVVCQTDSFSSRLWCQQETLAAKRFGVPMIVVDMRRGLEHRGISSLTHCPHFSLRGEMERLTRESAGKIERLAQDPAAGEEAGRLTQIGKLSREIADCGQMERYTQEIVELAVAEVLRFTHHCARSNSLLASAGIDPSSVLVLGRTPELLNMAELLAQNRESSAPGQRRKKLIIHPDPPLYEHDLDVLNSLDPDLQFLTPGTLSIPPRNSKP